MVVPVPRFLGRSQAGERTIRNRRPDSVASSSTRGATPGSAWSQRSRLAVAAVAGDRRRRARSRPRRARWSCRRRWAPESRNSPAPRRAASKSTVDVPGERAEGRDLQVVQPHQAPAPETSTSTSGSSQQASNASRSSAASASVGRRRPRMLGDEVEGDVVVAAPAGGGPPGAAAAAARGRVEARARACAGTGRRSRSMAWSGRRSSVRVACTQESSWPPRAGIGRAASRGCRAAGPARRGHRRVDELGGAGAVAPEVDQPGALALGGLGEGVGQRRAAVADRVGQRLRGRAGGRGRRSRRRRRPRSGTIETPPTLMSRSESLGSPPRRRRRAPARPSGSPGARGEVGADPAHRLGERRLVGAAGAAPTARAPRRGRGRGCRGPRPARARPRAARGCRRAPASVRMKTPAASISRELKPEPLGGVVVAAGEHDPGPRGGQPGQRLVGEPDRVDVAAAPGRRRHRRPRPGRRARTRRPRAGGRRTPPGG